MSLEEQNTFLDKELKSLNEAVSKQPEDLSVFNASGYYDKLRKEIEAANELENGMKQGLECYMEEEHKTRQYNEPNEPNEHKEDEVNVLFTLQQKDTIQLEVEKVELELVLGYKNNVISVIDMPRMRKTSKKGHREGKLLLYTGQTLTVHSEPVENINTVEVKIESVLEDLVVYIDEFHVHVLNRAFNEINVANKLLDNLKPEEKEEVYNKSILNKVESYIASNNLDTEEAKYIRETTTLICSEINKEEQKLKTKKNKVFKKYTLNKKDLK